MKTIYVCSPYRGDIKRNKEYAQMLAKGLIINGYAPVVPHLYIPEILNDDDTKQRKIAMKICKNLLKKCDYITIGADYGISEGMKQEIKWADKHGIRWHSYHDCLVASECLLMEKLSESDLESDVE